MIVREQTDGSLILIAQTDHALASGAFAAHWGNSRFAQPRPYESVVRAAILHDVGWTRYQAVPQLIEATGKVPTFTQVPHSPEQLDAFQWGIDWTTAIDPYAGLLVGMHRTGLWRGRYGTIREPAGFTARTPSDEVAQFTARNEARQEVERKAYDAAELATNYHLLQVWDLLSLYLCVREPREDAIDPVPVGYGEAAGEGVRMMLRPLDARRIAIDPYPFDVSVLTCNIVCRKLPVSTYPDQAAFRAAYYRAIPELLTFELVPA